MIAEADRLGVTDEMLADLSVLIDGFLQLIQSAESQRVAAQPAPPAVVPLRLPVVPRRPPNVPRVYSAGDEGVEPPVVIEQRMPALTLEMRSIIRAWGPRGVLSVVIDETGRVIDATIRPSLNSELRRGSFSAPSDSGSTSRRRKTASRSGTSRCSRWSRDTEADVYERYYGFREAPFKLTSNPKFLFLTDAAPRGAQHARSTGCRRRNRSRS